MVQDWLSDEPEAVREAALNVLRRHSIQCERAADCSACAYDRHLVEQLIDAIRLDALGYNRPGAAA